MNVTLSPAGVCWVEFADAGSAARAALRDGENSSGHSLRVTLLHPQPSQQPASLRAPAEWYPQQVDVTGAHLASDLASLRVRGPKAHWGRQSIQVEVGLPLGAWGCVGGRVSGQHA